MTHRSRTRFFFETLEGIAVLGGALLTWPLSKRWLAQWGSLAEEREREWPGDHLVPPTHHTYTRAISIGAPSQAVWPWIAQFGLGRAGFYSYECLERLVGIPVTNVESIEPSLQRLSVGDVITLHPKAPGIPIASLRPGHHLCFGEERDTDAPAAPSDPARSWSLYIEPSGKQASRLLLRSCIEPPRNPSWRTRLAAAIEAPIDFVMEQRMLRTIRRLAESQVDRGVRAR